MRAGVCIEKIRESAINKGKTGKNTINIKTKREMMFILWDTPTGNILEKSNIYL